VKKMAIDFSFAIGYGIVINKENFEAIEDVIEDIDDRNDWENKWARCLNDWADKEHFVGITYTVLDYGEDIKNFNKNKYRLNPKDTAEFFKFYDKYHLEKFFDWIPNCCAIAFIS
jgi:hypothetical protein